MYAYVSFSLSFQGGNNTQTHRLSPSFARITVFYFTFSYSVVNFETRQYNILTHVIHNYIVFISLFADFISMENLMKKYFSDKFWHLLIQKHFNHNLNNFHKFILTWNEIWSKNATDFHLNPFNAIYFVLVSAFRY